MASRTHPSSAHGIVEVLSAGGRSSLAHYLVTQRWFAAKARGIHAIAVEDWAVLAADPPLVLLLLEVDGERYYVPVTVAREAAEGAALARLGPEAIVDAHDDPRFGRHLLGAIASGRVLAGRGGRFRCRPVPSWTFPPETELASLASRRLAGEQSNTSIAIGETLILKSLRRPQSGINPDLEVTHFLTTRTDFRHVPRLGGWIEHAGRGGDTATVAVLQELVANTGDGWSHVIAALHRYGDEPDRGPAAELTGEIRRLGGITGGLHVALASDRSQPDFRPEPVTRADVRRWSAGLKRDLALLLADAATAADPRTLLGIGLGSRDDMQSRIERAADDLGLLADVTYKIRCHGDYHLGQVLKTPGGFVVIDFEGEPARAVDERRAKQAPLRDVAGMLRSLDYAAHAALAARAPAERGAAAARLADWERQARRGFLDGYLEAVAGSPVPLIPPAEEDLRRVGAAFELEKACYELRYELNNRPDWIAIPLAGIARILEAR